MLLHVNSTQAILSQGGQLYHQSTAHPIYVSTARAERRKMRWEGQIGIPVWFGIWWRLYLTGGATQRMSGKSEEKVSVINASSINEQASTRSHSAINVMALKLHIHKQLATCLYDEVHWRHWTEHNKLCIKPRSHVGGMNEKLKLKNSYDVKVIRGPNISTGV